jgi:chromosome partitioning protein
MRIDGRTNASQTLSDWSQALGVPYLGALRETQLYVRSLERGLTMFDLAPSQAAADLAQWEPIIEWLRPVLQPAPATPHREPVSTQASRVLSSRPDSQMPPQESLMHRSRLDVLSGARSLNQEQRIPVRTLPQAAILEEPEIPRFLKA